MFCTNHIAWLIYQHCTENHNRECREGHSSGTGYIFYFEGLNQIVLDFKVVFLWFSAQRRWVKWSWVSFYVSQATACIRKIDEVICIKVQRWNTLFVFTLCILKTVKAKVKFHIKANDSILVEFHGSHTLFTSILHLIVLVWFVRVGTVGWWFSIYFLLLVQLHLSRMFASLSETQHTLKTYRVRVGGEMQI